MSENQIGRDILSKGRRKAPDTINGGAKLLKNCRDCGLEKELSEFSKYTSGKHRPICNKCLYKMQKKSWDRRPVEKKLRQLANGVLQRTDAHSNDPKNSYYREKGITCELGNSSKEVYRYLLENHYDEVSFLLGSGQTPSVDRIDPALSYVPGNVRIIPLEENVKLALENAHEKLSKKVRITYNQGKAYDFKSVREAAKVVGVSRTTLNEMLKGNRLSGKDFTISEIRSDINAST